MHGDGWWPCTGEDPTSKLARSEAGERPPTHSAECLRSEARRPWPMKRWSNSSLQVIDPKASAAPSWSGMMSATIPRSMSDPLDGQCMLTAVLRRCSSVRQVTAVEGDTPSKVHDVTMLIDAAHRHACTASVRTHGSRAIKRESVATAHPHVRPWCQEARRALLCDENDRYRSNLATSCSC